MTKGEMIHFLNNELIDIEFNCDFNDYKTKYRINCYTAILDFINEVEE